MGKEHFKYEIGILAYGSLINDPGDELGPLIAEKIACTTPFDVEYGRLSKTRGGAPTLIPVKSGGSSVSACLLVLDAKVSLSDAKSMLWRRETRIKGRSYVHPEKAGKNNVVVESVAGFQDCRMVLYTAIGSNVPGEITAVGLAKYAIDSILTNAGSHKMDGLRYLMSAIDNGIYTTLTAKFLEEIQHATETASLLKAIAKLDLKRSIDRFAGYLTHQKSVDHLAVAGRIREAASLADKLKIYAENYSFVGARGRIYTKNENGDEAEEIICNCQNCQRKPDFRQRYQIYEPFLEAEVIDLQLYLDSDLPYDNKLKVWHFVTGGASSIEFGFSKGHNSISLRPKNEREVKIENNFCYELVLESFFRKQSSIPQLFGKDFQTRKMKFLAQFSNSLYKKEFMQKTIAVVRENSEGIRDEDANAIFNRLVDGEVINLSTEVIEYGKMYKQVVANEEYLFLKFLEENEFESMEVPIIRVEKSVRPIHFEDRSSVEFERLVFAYLLKTSHWDSLEWLGEAGNDGGRDIWGVMAGETYCFQCANYRRMERKKAAEDIDKLLKDGRVPTHWVLYCGGRVGNQVREAIKSYGFAAGINSVSICSGGEFEELLRHRTPSLIKRFVEGETFPEPEIPDFAEVNNSMVVLVKGMFRDWLHHEILPSVSSLFSIFKNVTPHQLSSIEMVFLILALHELSPDFDFDENGEINEFSFDHFFPHFADSATQKIPILGLKEQERYQIHYNGYITTHSSRSKNLPVNNYTFHAFRILDDGRKTEVFFTKGFDLKVELRIGVS